MTKIKILLVCTENICRSPMAQGILSQLLESEGLGRRCRVDSAGTHVSQAGSRPDQRAQRVAQTHNIDLSGMRARQIRKGDYSSYDYIVAMDQHNLEALRKSCPEANAETLCLLVDFAQELKLQEVPDPYYGNVAGFVRVFEILDAGLRGLLGHIRRDLTDRGLDH
ncbi:MAG: low molecular weight phosphotyrosine protein phosphatase [Gammaproteobacteria bacterium]|nr:low molecular weight phosphotyrosine protein phosphatase [Gammaproteobacteria bacterium]